MVLSLGRVAAHRIECTVSVRDDETSISGDDTLVDRLPSRIEMDWAGRWLQRNDEGGFVLRKLNLHRYIDGTESDEMPSTWQVTPDFRYAVVSRVKGTPD